MCQCFYIVEIRLENSFKCYILLVEHLICNKPTIASHNLVSNVV